ncbi:MAG: response regulator receiver [Deinococcus sp.]|nr:response regulator receiver [Deinococcus sp.]
MTAPAVRRVLIIEDCLADALLLKLAFEDAAPDVQVQSVTDSAAGLAQCRSADAPQLVVLDLHLPGTVGLEVLTELYSVPQAPLQVVCWSSHAHPTEVQAVLDQGAVAYLEKPRELPGFLQVVQTLMTL